MAQRKKSSSKRRANTGFRATRDAASFFNAIRPPRSYTVFKCKCCSRTRQRRYFSSTKRVSYVGGSVNETFVFCYFCGLEFLNFSNVHFFRTFRRFPWKRIRIIKNTVKKKKKIILLNSICVCAQQRKLLNYKNNLSVKYTIQYTSYER